jgi:hypothetical protein
MRGQCEPLDLRALALAPAVRHQSKRHSQRAEVVQRLDCTGKGRNRGVAKLEMPVADHGAEGRIIDAESGERVRGDPPPRLTHPRPPLPMSICIAPEQVAHPLDLSQERLGVDLRTSLSCFVADEPPALVPRAGVVENRVVEIKEQDGREGRHHAE